MHEGGDAWSAHGVNGIDAVLDSLQNLVPLSFQVSAVCMELLYSSLSWRDFLLYHSSTQCSSRFSTSNLVWRAFCNSKTAHNIDAAAMVRNSTDEYATATITQKMPPDANPMEFAA